MGIDLAVLALSASILAALCLSYKERSQRCEKNAFHLTPVTSLQFRFPYMYVHILSYFSIYLTLTSQPLGSCFLFLLCVCVCVFFPLLSFLCLCCEPLCYLQLYGENKRSNGLCARASLHMYLS